MPKILTETCDTLWPCVPIEHLPVSTASQTTQGEIALAEVILKVMLRLAPENREVIDFNLANVIFQPFYL